MNNELKRNGFSLTEVLMAVGILSIGLIFIAGVFPVGIHFTTVVTERTKAAIAADEAFAKIMLYGIDFIRLLDQDANTCVDFYEVADVNEDANVPSDEFAYPSTDISRQKTYYWSALCRYIEGQSVQVTVFVCRKIGAGTEYWCRNPDGSLGIFEDDYPVPVWVEVSQPDGFNLDELQIIDSEPTDGTNEATFINDGCTIVDDTTGRLYRVLERIPYNRPDNDIIKLDRDWRQNPSVEQEKVWVIPPPVDGGRYPCIAVYQRVIKF
jgi:prepilin-type N-terminal cleavage/methylation domain-containing protein